MGDYIVRGTAADSSIRFFASTTRDTVEFARKAHNTSPVVTAALGRLLTAGGMMGVMMKGEKDVITLQIRSDGPIRGITVTADSQGRVKGYPNNPTVIIPANKNGKLDVARAVGQGILNVIRDMGLKEPYNGQTVLQTSEIAEDLTYYFANSEQVPSAVGLGVLMSKDNTVKQAGGFIIQLMPFTDEKIIDKLEAKLATVTSVTDMLEKGMTPEDIVNDILGEFGVEFTDRIDTYFKCSCSKERVESVLHSIDKKEIKEMIKDGKPINVECHFCNTSYEFTIEELKKLL